MNINKLMPTVMGIIIIALLALATSCATSKVTVSKHGMHVNKNYSNCPAYN